MTPASKPLCPECGKAAIGNFCQHCGATLGGRFCDQCGAKTAPAAAFCNQCGAKMRAGGRRAAAASVIGGHNLPWWIAGAAMFVVILVVGVRMVQPAPSAAPTQSPAAPFAGGGGGGVPPDLSGMTMREAADRLFNRVMTYVSEGDSASAKAFAPMAIDAYNQARPLDHDGLFHLSLINRAAGNVADALANAQEVLQEDPNHLLALTAAAEAAAELGRSDEAAGYYRRVLEAYDAEMAGALPEYADHSVFLQSVRDEAEAFLAGR
ncbi:MAG TPA: zinc ribbon domain-containing protein [Longimicrobiales bacterium]|nr:zinc ribbon domain-containing protein [Longimicrobiales bacterium]